jgi:ubiquinone/menaquinone biosynthesis C-methylase UbiE
MRLCRDGITEAVRVLRPGGHLLVKCQDQVCSGKVRWQSIDFSMHGIGLGLQLVDRLELVSYRPQPAGRRQVHARRNHSTMLVLRRSA